MKYLRVDKVDGKTYELDYESAKELLARNYTERVCTFDEMLSTPNEFPCMYCTLIVYKA